MAWKPGQTGNPAGTLREKTFYELFRQVGTEIDATSGKRKARALVERVYSMALKGESWACNVVLERTDGKAIAETAITLQTQQVREMADDELLALLVKYQAAERKEDETLQ